MFNFEIGQGLSSTYVLRNRGILFFAEYSSKWSRLNKNNWETLQVLGFVVFQKIHLAMWHLNIYY